MLATVTRGQRVRNVPCPDGVRRSFCVMGGTAERPKGYVQVGNVSVAGYLRRQGRGLVFRPHPEGKNIHLVRPAAYDNRTQVVVTSRESSMFDKTGTVQGVTWNYLSPIYTIQPTDLRRRPVVVPGEFVQALDNN